MSLTSKDITMGSGNLYLYPMNTNAWANYSPCVSPALTDIEQEQYRIGHISGGATLSYEPTFFSIKDDMGLVGMTGLQEENVSFQSGILTWDPSTLKQITATGAVTTVNNVSTLSVGGMAQYAQPDYLLHFQHASNGKWLDLKPAIQSGWEISFVKDNATVIDLTFGAEPMPGQDGALFKFSQAVNAQ